MEELALLEGSSNGKFQTATEDTPRSKPWVTCPASAKSIRTINPIRALVDPIVANGIKSGEERGDGKDLISLAVSSVKDYYYVMMRNPHLVVPSRILRVLAHDW